MTSGSEFEVVPLRNSNVQYLFTRRNEIDFNPPYQRQSEAWNMAKQQLLIDSIINGFDVPTIYLHRYAPPLRRGGKTFTWALVDGKQRLEAIFGFMDNEFALADDFKLLRDGSGELAGKTKKDLEEADAILASDLQVSDLDVKEIRTADPELIEEMFSRLNEAVPLNAAEKRNAFGGPLPKAVRDLVKEAFFTAKLPFSNRRYRHYDLAAKFLYLADGLLRDTSVTPARDVKKLRLDRYFKEVKESDDQERATAATVKATRAIDSMAAIFIDSDPLLTGVGMVTVYYLLALKCTVSGRGFPQRAQLIKFDEDRQVNLAQDEVDLSKSDVVFLQFSQYNQSPNDGAALDYRLAVLEAWLEAKDKGQDALEAVAKLYDAEETVIAED